MEGESDVIIILGDRGHSRVVADIFGPGTTEIRPWNYSRFIDGDKLVFGMANATFKAQLVKMWGGNNFIAAISMNAVVTVSVILGNACQIMAGAIVQPGALIGHNVLINTGAQVDHDCVIGNYTHIAPGAILCGNVTLGEDCQIGAGAIIVQGVTLDAGTKIPAGTLVVGQDDLRRPQRVVRSD